MIRCHRKSEQPTSGPKLMDVVPLRMDDLKDEVKGVAGAVELQLKEELKRARSARNSSLQGYGFEAELRLSSYRNLLSRFGDIRVTKVVPPFYIVETYGTRLPEKMRSESVDLAVRNASLFVGPDAHGNAQQIRVVPMAGRPPRETKESLRNKIMFLRLFADTRMVQE